MNEEDVAFAAALRSITAETLQHALQVHASRRGASKTKALDATTQHLRAQIASAFVASLVQQGGVTEGADAEEAVAENGGATYRLRLSCVDTDRVPLPTRQTDLTVKKHETCQAHLTCTQCRRPLEISVGQEPSNPRQSTQGRRAYVVILQSSKEASFLQAFVLGLCLARHCGVQERVLIHSPAVPAAYLKALKSLWYLEPSHGSWSEVQNKQVFQDERLVMMRALGLKYDKVLVFQLGSIVNSNLDEVFDIDCPACVQLLPRSEAQGPQRKVLPLLLLQPSSQALRRICSETAHRWQNPAFPPRRGSGEDELYDYLTSFFRTFGKTDLQQLPTEFIPARVEAAADLSCRIFFCRPDSSWLGEQMQNGDTLQGLLRAILADDFAKVEELFPMLDEANCQRCVDCGLHDAMGRQDELDSRWRCRFCREQLLLSGASKDSLSCIPLPLHEAKELQEKLGQFFMGGRRQRWYWTSWKITHWVELRPANVIWHSKHGAGTWQMWKDRDAKHQVAIYLHERRGQDEKVKEEVRYILWHKAGSDPPVFEESPHTRKVLRSAGFAQAQEGPATWAVRLEASASTSTREMGNTNPEASGTSQARAAPMSTNTGMAEVDRAQRSTTEGIAVTQGGDVRAKLSYLLQPRGTAGPPKKATEEMADTDPGRMTETLSPNAQAIPEKPELSEVPEVPISEEGREEVQVSSQTENREDLGEDLGEKCPESKGPTEDVQRSNGSSICKVADADAGAVKATISASPEVQQSPPPSPEEQSVVQAKLAYLLKRR